ncbi:Putative lymphocyte G0/G1 switch protein 2 [Myotis davidii]|uniref:Putative lymphocyte G0/G1 switch protein 2 n=1 Tax=Myotis davidii TaxID=225400 RepID=L5LNN6_MYODS|nr:Putative lymphocyte G0/G1 switch protein 2 [Myotis davidii]
METVQELIPLVKEMIAQKPSRRLVKVYVLGGVLALFGVVLVLVETVCSGSARPCRHRPRRRKASSTKPPSAAGPSPTGSTPPRNCGSPAEGGREEKERERARERETETDADSSRGAQES